MPYEKEIENTLEAKQEIVGGLIQCTSILGDPDVSLICNEEGKIMGLPMNRDIDYDIIAGTFIIAGEVDEEGDFTSLTPEQVLKYKKRFGKESIVETENKLTAMMLKNNFKDSPDINY